MSPTPGAPLLCWLLMRSAALVLLALLAGTGCAGDRADEVTVTVFAAASLADAFGTLETAFEASHPEADVRLHLAGSQQLAQQLRLGAPADVFASADEDQMAAAVEAGRIAPEAPVDIARNRLVVAVAAGTPELETFADLAHPGLRLVLADEAVPAGRYARDALRSASSPVALGAGFERDVLHNVVSLEQNVRAVLTKVELGEADAGIVYATDLQAADPVRVRRLAVPAPYDREVLYPIAVVLDAPHPEPAQSFVAFVRSAEGRQVLTRHGFLPPADAP